MAKDKKAKAAQKKARVAAKTEKKTAAKDKKVKARPKASAGADDSSDDADADLDAILASYAAAQEAHHKITERVLPAPPPAVASATLLANPGDSREVLLFGGEALTAAGTVRFSNDLYAYRPASDQWRAITSPNAPLPRSGHAWCRAANAPAAFLFGGEFSSPKQGTFHHYNDLWRLDGAGREWARVEAKGGPAARSGHRMVGFRRYVLLFGGFQDQSRSTRYLNDVWAYDTVNYAWFEPKLGAAAQRPEPRSSFSFLPHEAGAVVVGGYSRVKVAGSKGRTGKGGVATTVMKPVVHQDCWLLRVVEPGKDEGERAPPTVRWERRKRPVNLPSPARAGATMAHHKGRGILFGGVHDVEESDEGIESEFFNQLCAYNIDRNRFFPLGLRRPRAAAAGKRGPPAERSRRARGKADEEELLRNLALIEGKGGVAEAERAGTKAAARSDDEDDEPVVDKPVAFEMPHPRFNAQLAVQDDTLFIYGGTFERGDREFTFDELWAIDLGKMDGVRELFRREIEDWATVASSESDESDDDDDGDDDSEGDEDSDAEADDAVAAAAAAPPTAEAPSPAPAPADPAAAESDPDEPKTAKDDGLPYPRPFEALRDFSARTTLEWQTMALAAARTGVSAAAPERSAKEIKRLAFDMAERRWWDVREEMQALEDEREEGGIGEVVQLGDRGGEGGGAKRR